ncbi:polysaccharide deacetylase family protein [Psychroserpens ponticola]|uniref:Polysaccharide deacetylase family protein n=1 Tax=Psychroserpens ponticola TaxID=2932268 RepID=A0ABY7RZI3_9FLAO|nr:polysaccharide deacetylase family protein [Psychroserpens ponticola]WCO02544.1 polysaccharide deacetylase family protein [Psychroserpens ponticola]
MIKSIQLLSKEINKNIDFTFVHDYKVLLDALEGDLSSFSLKIEFNCLIVSFRNHDYTWVDINQRRISNWYSPKLLKLENNQIVQSNQNIGIWDVNTNRKNILLWHFNPDNANPISSYDKSNSKNITQAVSKVNLDEPLSFLFSNHFGIEVSRSKFPFSAIACFTDHCDFDTLNNLIEQRHFFKEHNIKVTKGFFLNHYSKRKDTASIEFNKDEIEEWIKDGHELAYHSLSQSLKSQEESFIDFLSFKPPFENISTWIDHGFQPYNFTLSNCKDEIKDNYGNHLKERHINKLWSYIDSGTAVDGVINQINPNYFTLHSFYKGINHLGVKAVTSLMIKNIIFHYFNDDYGLSLYRQVANYVKTIKLKKSRIKHLYFAVNMIKLMVLFIPIILFWRFKRHKVYQLAEFAPVFFEHIINGKSFTVFQTLEMINFKRALSKNNLDLLIREKGLFIAHTYFSAPMNYHKGKLFDDDNDKIDSEVEERFKYLSQKINSKDIWNPTLKELITHMKKINHIVFDCNEKGEIFIINDYKLVSRQVK